MTLTAEVAFTHINEERATAALRGDLRRQAALGNTVADWSTFVVRGPQQQTGAHGMTWHVWTGTVVADR